MEIWGGHKAKGVTHLVAIDSFYFPDDLACCFHMHVTQVIWDRFMVWLHDPMAFMVPSELA